MGSRGDPVAGKYILETQIESFWFEIPFLKNAQCVSY